MKKNKGLQAVTHPSTDQAQCCLTSVIKGLVALAVCNTLGALAATFRTKTPVKKRKKKKLKLPLFPGGHPSKY
jgi:hypothetical protein